MQEIRVIRDVPRSGEAYMCAIGLRTGHAQASTFKACPSRRRSGACPVQNRWREGFAAQCPFCQLYAAGWGRELEALCPVRREQAVNGVRRDMLG
jgi:hypothetical protein